MKKQVKFSLSSDGFSLVELLVAATIIGMLAVFATTAYRGSVAETRWAQAKAHTQQLAIAAERAKVDYRGYGVDGEGPTFSAEAMTNIPADSCDFRSSTAQSPRCLLTKDYVEAGPWGGKFVSFYICDIKIDGVCTNTAYTACVRFKDTAKVPAKFKNYRYCYSSEQGGAETL